MGFNTQTAEAIATRLAQRPNPDPFPGTLLKYAEAHVRSPFQHSELSAAQDLMTKVGLTERLANCLPNPKCEDVTGTETLAFWVIDTIQVDVEGMTDIVGRLEERGASMKDDRRNRSSVPSVLRSSQTAAYGAMEMMQRGHIRRPTPFAVAKSVRAR
ncbi:hypothetical protein BAUCODRAFT_407009 [Baudoinia panamericana UAMH 10762]|uniref:Uncharacterized protein n=1 Tax=Baudoinia panamericana (strain UAMH 10762) TaxID=717646 RepID=M2N1U2_BAUPA|nr:uncharacterized protein BAUCODRAFT_407009 [Baudoinia panamericana UAMH 10762]EMC97893.1 hypothetical protein BAUCODRAFT_407009 [Baudoinia panamericana UAMH 10762]